jgi:hypothetical protein
VLRCVARRPPVVAPSKVAPRKDAQSKEVCDA